MSRISYWDRIKAYAYALQGDGCTSSPDLTYTECCDEHDIHYRTGQRIDGTPITREESDRELFECMRRKGKTPLVGKFIVPVIYYSAVRVFGGQAWKAGSEESPDKPESR